MFAHTNHEFERGEFTSDYLGYFGFGSGRYDGNQPPAFTQDWHLFKFPSIESLRAVHAGNPNADTAIFVELLNLLRKLVAAYAAHGWLLDYTDVNRFARYAQKLCKVDLSNYFYDKLREDWGYTVNTTKLQLAPCLLVVGVDHSYSTYLAFGGPNLSTDGTPLDGGSLNAPTDLTRTVASDNRFWNWNASSNIGDGNHALGIMRTMSRKTFMDCGAEVQAEKLGGLIERVGTFYDLVD